MIKIRLDRTGVRNKPKYRIVAVESTKKKGGRALEVLGFWLPKTKTLKLKRDRLNFWISKGAKLSKSMAEQI